MSSTSDRMASRPKRSASSALRGRTRTSNVEGHWHWSEVSAVWWQQARSAVYLRQLADRIGYTHPTRLSDAPLGSAVSERSRWCRVEAPVLWREGGLAREVRRPRGHHRWVQRAARHRW